MRFGRNCSSSKFASDDVRGLIFDYRFIYSTKFVLGLYIIFNMTTLLSTMKDETTLKYCRHSTLSINPNAIIYVIACLEQCILPAARKHGKLMDSVEGNNNNRSNRLITIIIIIPGQCLWC